MVNKKKCADRLTNCNREVSLSHFSIDDYPDSDPAAGYRNGTSLNNDGSNGNYWSSTPNESNTNNAYNLNFNSGNHNVNWNNRNNGFSVRPVVELTLSVAPHEGRTRLFSISREQLLLDLYRAYKDARRHKRGRNYQLKFEFKLEENLVELRDELYEGRYCPGCSTCFVIHDPKMREVFAAHFRDRIVHHLFYNYTHTLFERTFISDSYSCITGRGTHYGIERMKHHIRSVSQGYSYACYVMKIDIRGYFMHINRELLYKICWDTLTKMKKRKSDVPGKTWGDKLDYVLLEFLLDKIIYSNPLDNCCLLGQESDWVNLPPEKSLFCAQVGCGLPIGNLSSQLFSNVYMNRFDQFVKRELGCKHYGRYVDDAYIVADNRSFLHSLIPLISKFLRNELGLILNTEKLRIIDARYGVEFLGAYIKPFRTYIARTSLQRIKRKIPQIPQENSRRFQSSINSFLGVMSHYDSYHLRRIIFGHSYFLNRYGAFDSLWLRYKPYST